MMSRISCTICRPRPAALLGALALALVCLPAGAATSGVPMLEVPASEASAKSAVLEAPPLALAAQALAEPFAALGEIEKGAGDQLEAIRLWNGGGHLPLRNGVERPLPVPQEVRFGAGMIAQAAGLLDGGVFARASAGSMVWGTEVRVEGSYRLRLHLADLQVPAGTRFWIYGEDGESVAFGPELAGPDGLWTPSVAGPVARLEVELADAALEAGEPGFTVDRVLEMVRLDSQGLPLVGANATVLQKADVACLRDVTCTGAALFPSIRAAERAIAQLTFVDGGFSFVCTGSLLNDRDETTLRPFLLTANHCFDNQGSAASLEALFDLKTSTCGGAPPNPNQLPRVNGSTLRGTGQESDFTLVELAQKPAGTRTYLGWSPDPVAAGTTLHRISHPVANNELYTQVYTQYEVLPTQPCGGSRANYYNLEFMVGGTFGGSSGAPNMLGNGQVVGHLTGACGPIPSEGCDYRNIEVDGAFSRSIDFLADVLDNEPEEPEGPECPAGYFTSPLYPDFCFDVTISAGGAIQQSRLEEDCISETLCISGAVPGRSELFVRIIGPRPNGYLWPTLVRFTPSQVRVAIYQLSNEVEKVYILEEIPPGVDALPGLQDRMGFLP